MPRIIIGRLFLSSPIHMGISGTSSLAEQIEVGAKLERLGALVKELSFLNFIFLLMFAFVELLPSTY